jgi:hypothetical protein
MIERLRGYVRDAGRPAAAVGIQGRISIGQTPEAQWATVIQQWGDLGAEYVSVNTMGAGLASPEAHIDAIRRFKERVT